MNTNSPREQAIFEAARRLTDPAERDAYLRQACGGNAELLAQVAKLLAALDQGGSFLESPPSGVAGALPDTYSALDGAPVGSATIERSISEQAGSSIGPYKLLQQIGEGGFGVVYMAEQQQPIRRKVALKIIKPGMDSREVLARFEAERQALALMDHPNIAKVLDGGLTETGRPYFVMELVKGVPLIQFCDENRIDTPGRLKLFAAVCKAIQHAHQKGIIHRDIKPSNVMVTLHDGEPVPKVIDFGVSKALAQQLTERTLFTVYGQMIGTPQYMSPEQAEMSGLDIDTRSDVYSLGVLLYELLTGTTPLELATLRGKALAELQRMIRETEAPPPSLRLSSVGAQLPTIAAQRNTDPPKLSALLRGELDWIVLKALEKNRNRRYETASDFAHDVERYLRDEPVLACPPTWAYRLSKVVRRQRGPLLVAGSLLLILQMGLVLALFSYSRVRDAYRQAERARLVALDAEENALANATRAQVALENLQIAQRDTQEALQQRSRALERSETTRLAAQSLATLPTDPALALLTAVESARRMPDLAAANNALIASLSQCREVRTLAHPDNAQLTDALLSTDERTILGVESTRIGVWDVTSGKLLRWISSADRLQNIQVRWSPDDRHIAVFGRGGCLVVAEDGARYGFTDRVVRLFDTLTGKEIAVLRGHSDRVTDVRYLRDGQQLVSSSWDGTVRIWDSTTGALRKTLEFGTSVAQLRLTSDNTLVVAVREPQPITSIPVWESLPNGSEALTLDPPLNLVPVEDGAPRGTQRVDGARNVATGAHQRLGEATAAPEPLVKYWRLPEGELAGTWKHPRMGTVAQFEVPDGKEQGTRQILLRAASPIVVLGNLLSGELLAEAPAAVEPESQLALRDAQPLRPLTPLALRLVEQCGDRRRALEYFTAGRLSNDGRWATTVQQNQIVVQTLDDARSMMVLKGHPSGAPRIVSVQFTRDASRLVSAGDHTIRIWDVSPADVPSHRLAVTLHGHPGSADLPTPEVNWVEFGPTSKMVAVSSSDGRTRLFDAVTGKLSATLRGPRTENDASQSFDPLLARSLGPARLARFNADGTKLAILSDDPRSFVEAKEADQPLEPLPFTPLRVWDVGTQQLVWSGAGNYFEQRPTVAEYNSDSMSWGFRSATFTADGQFVVTTDDDSDRYRILSRDGGDRQSGERRGIIFTPPGQPQPAAPRFAIRVWNAKSGELVRTLAATRVGSLCYVSPSGRCALIPDDKGFQVVNPITGEERGHLSGSVALNDVPVAWSADDQWFAAVSHGLFVWQLAAATAPREFDLSAHHTTSPRILQFTPDGSQLVTASNDGTANVWNVKTGAVTACFRGSTRAITCLDMSPNGIWCATGGTDSTVQIWKLETGTERMTIPVGAPVRSVRWNDSSDQLAVAARNDVYVWPLDLLKFAESRVPRQMTEVEQSRLELK